jgi:putative DNA primase/helicase
MAEVVAMDDDRFRPLTEDEREQTVSGPAGESAKDDDWDLIVPIPDTVPAPGMRHWILGDPVAVWVYRDRNGDRVCFIGRYNKANGDKEFWPRTWRKNRETGKEEWRWKNVPDPRPLYGLELLAQRPNAPVIVVEGEKCADVARRLFPGYVAVSPMNGARSPQLADWSPLQGRDITLCRDNDESGKAFEQTVGRILLHLACKVSAVDIAALVALAISARGAAVKAEGWDIADAARLWETPEGLRAAVLGLVRPFVPSLDLSELERGEQATFDLLVERCRGEPTCVTADVGIFNALKRLSQNPLKARAWETLRSFLKGARVDVAGLNRAIKAAIETEAYGKAGSGAKAGPARAAAGLAEGYWHDEDDGAVWTTEIVGRGLFRTQQDVRLCSSARVVRGESDGFGYNWSISVEIRDERQAIKEVLIRKDEAATDTTESIRALVNAGLRIYAPQTQTYHRLILDGFLKAGTKLAYRLTKAGWFPLHASAVFAIPSGVIGDVGDNEILWGGKEDVCITSQSGTLASWKANVCACAEGNAIPMVCTGTMIASPAIPYLPKQAEKNTMLHFVSTSSGGKTTSTRCGATVWGLGATTEVEGTFLKSWKTTANASESLLAGHNHIGLALDELKTVDAKAAGTFAYDFAIGRSKLRMNAKLATRQGPSWALFAISSGEVTLAERANDNAFRKQLQDAGAEARVINIPTDINLFPNLNGHASGEAFAQALGTASTEHYGHAGRAFVGWLIANGDEARKRLEANLAFWKGKTDPLLKTGANPQALRIASRLGSIAAAAALAADVIEFPWSAPEGIESEHLGPAGKAMIWAFLEALKLWLGKNGSKVSTQIVEAMSQLRNFYSGAPPAAFPITSRDETTEKDLPDQPQTAARRGFRVMSGMRNGIDGKPGGGMLEYVDFLPAVLRQNMNWSEVTRRGILHSLRDQKLLVVSRSDEFTYTRRVDGRIANVHRVKASFFGEE